MAMTACIAFFVTTGITFVVRSKNSVAGGIAVVFSSSVICIATSPAVAAAVAVVAAVDAVASVVALVVAPVVAVIGDVGGSLGISM